MAPADHRVTLLSKPGCHLCEEAREVVEAVCGALGVPWDERDITQDEALFDEHRDDIPVTLVDGEVHDFWRVNPDRLRAALMS